MFNEKGNYQYPGDMVKSTYDSNNDGVVNAADTVPWSGVTNTPDTLSGYGIEEVPASVLSGVIGAEHIPPSAVERMKIVENDSMRFALTTADVQNGDTVKVTATNKMYLVVDDGNLDSESGYAVYEAGRAAAVDWTGVENKPETIENIDDILDTSEEESEEGNPVTFETESAQMAKSTKLTFAPIQDLHGYDHPWPEGGGKNLFDKSTVTNGYYIESDGTITEASAWCVSDYMPVTEGSYIASGYATNGSGVYLAVYNANKEYIRSVTMIISAPATTAVTISTGEAYVRMSVRTFAGEQNTAQFEKGSTATSYEPYSNICPISGADEVDVVVSTGKNLFGGEANALFRLFIPSGTRVTASDLGGGNVRYYDAYQNEIDYWTLINTESVSGRKYRSFAVSSDTYFVKFDVGSTTASDFQLEVGSAPTSYEPYISHTASLDFPETVYGGTLDLETGKVVCDKAMAKVSDLTWNRYYHFNQSPSLANFIKHVATRSEKSSAITSCYTTIPWNSDDDMSFSVNIDGKLSITDSRYSTVDDWLSNVANEQIVYELATPITYTLTPKQLALLKGTNHISTNAKSVKVTFRAGQLATLEDVAGAVEVAKQNAIGESASYTDARLATELAPILGDLATAETSPASASHAVGEYLLYNNRLYKVLTAISAGQQLTIGTNIGQTNVAAELASQASMITVINSRMSDTAGFHNGIYRGKDITSYLTDGTLWNRIKGTGGYALFADLYLGDYITVGSNSYAIVDFDYYLRCGSVDLNEHHIVMMPTENMNIPEGTALYGVSGQTLQFINTANAGVTVSLQESATRFKWNAKMSDPNTHNTNGGYKYSRMRQVIMKAANTIVINAFGSSHVKPITVLYPNPSSETASGIASGWAWLANDDQSAADAKSLCDLPNETQIYGQQVWGRGTVYTNMGYEVGTDKFQFAICALQRNFVDTRADWWLRSVYWASLAAYVSDAGTTAYYSAAAALGVRPRFLLVG